MNATFGSGLMAMQLLVMARLSLHGGRRRCWMSEENDDDDDDDDDDADDDGSDDDGNAESSVSVLPCLVPSSSTAEDEEEEADDADAKNRIRHGSQSAPISSRENNHVGKSRKLLSDLIKNEW
jgi:hypothetical protein